MRRRKPSAQYQASQGDGLLIYLVLCVISGMLFLLSNGHMSVAALIACLGFFIMCPVLTFVGVITAFRCIPAHRIYWLCGSVVAALPGLYMLGLAGHIK